METTSPAEPVVILINRSLNYGSVGRVTGHSGVDYGDSFHEEAYAAHVCRMPLSKWRECKQDVTFAARLPLRQWEVDIELPDSPSGGEDVIARVLGAQADALDGIVSGLSPLVQAVLQRAKELAREKPVVPDTSPSTSAPKSVGPQPAQTATDPLAGAKWFTLVKIAKELGIDANAFGSCQTLRDAIFAKQCGAPIPTPATGIVPPPGPGEYFDVRQPKAAKPKPIAGGKTT